MQGSQPWGPADATSKIRRIARDPKFTITFAGHARDQMLERGLYAGDVLYILKNGFVYEDPVRSTQPGLFKYRVENLSPNGGSRSVRVVAIPDEVSTHIKVITVMWVDET